MRYFLQGERRLRVARPSIPALCWCACLLWLGCFIAGMVPFGSEYFLTCSAVLLLVALLFVCVALIRKKALFAFLFLFLCLGIVMGYAFSASLEAKRETLVQLPTQTYRFLVIEDPSATSFGYSLTCFAWPEEAGFLVTETYKVRLYTQSDSFTYADEFCATTYFSTPSASALSSCNQKGIVATCSLSEIKDAPSSVFGLIGQVRSFFGERLDELSKENNWDTSASGLLGALVIGDRSELFDSFFYQEVKACGLAHLVAVSGSHLVIVLGLLRALLSLTRLSRRVSAGIQIGFLIAYLVMVGLPISCIRAALMASLSLISPAAARRSHALSALGAAIIVILVSDPSAAYSVSFGLSALSTLGIVLFAPLLVSWFPASSRKIQEGIISPFALTLAATAATFPLSIAVFSQFSLIAPIANVAVAPLVCLICGVGVLAFIAMPLVPLSNAFLWVAYGGSWLFCRLVDAFMMLPFVCIPAQGNVSVLAFFAFGLAALLWVVWPRTLPWKTLCSFCLVIVLLGIGIALNNTTKQEVIMLDVGQGDAFVVRSRGCTALIDTGNRPSLLFSALARQGIYRLDVLIVSHADDDHCGALEDMAGIVSCDAVVLAQGMSELAASTPKVQSLIDAVENFTGSEHLCEIGVGEQINIGSFTLEAISPDNLTDEGSNADSLCLLLKSDINNDAITEWTGLFCGDAEADTLASLIASGTLGKIDLYKVGHHGSAAALTNSVAQALSPAISLISVGEGNSYGHPRAETLALLEEVGSQIFRTDTQGDVVCRFTSTTLSVSTMR